MSDDKQYYHNEGQKDAAAGDDFSPPHGVERLVTHFFISEETRAREDAENEAYREGYTNAEKQKNNP